MRPNPQSTLYVGVCRLSLLAAHCHSLKEKRAVVRKLKDRVRARFRIPLSEVGGQDTWQRLVLAFAVVGSDRQKVETLVQDIVRCVSEIGDAELTGAEREIVSYGEGAMGDPEPGWWTASADDADTTLVDEDQALAVEAETLADDSWIPDSWKSDPDMPDMPDTNDTEEKG